MLTVVKSRARSEKLMSIIYNKIVSVIKIKLIIFTFVLNKTHRYETGIRTNTKY